MERRRDNVKRHPSGPAKRRATKLKKPLYARSSTNKSALNDTLPDDIFLDSFDKFLYNDKQDLRAKNVLVKDIRASFNRDSSIDESDASYSQSSSHFTLNSVRESEIDESEDIENSVPIDDNVNSVPIDDNVNSVPIDDNENSDPIDDDENSVTNDEANESMPNTSVAVNSNSDSSKLNSSHSIHQPEMDGTNIQKYHELSKITLPSLIESSCVRTPIRLSILTSSTPMSLVNKPKLSVKPRVVFYAEDSVHELSNVTDSHNESSLRLPMKGGKWRRTIYEIRKNKVTLSPRRTLERLNEIKSCHGITLRRKSIYIKDIPDRKTINQAGQRTSHTINLGHRESHRNVTTLDDAYVNVRPRVRTIRFQEIVNESTKSIATSASIVHSQVNLSESSCVESTNGESEHSPSIVEISSNQDLLKIELLQRCGQSEVLPFDETYSASVLNKCRKIGEGVFGEVFLNETSSRSSYVLKVIPIEGSEEINGAVQKRFDEILQEVIISQELSTLRHGTDNKSAGFVEVLNIRLVEGRYPAHLLALWNDYDMRRQSDNDCPDVFGDDQLYIVFELANGGTDLEAYVFKNAEESFSAFKQVALSLAVAESQFEFEHRDLHWGNVLVTPTTEPTLTFSLNGKSIKLRTYGIKATIIDYTLSRLVYKECCLFQDLATDAELFEANGDYQFDIYRSMKTYTNNVWEVFEPFTNVLWLHYTIDKMVNGVNYSATKSVKHRKVVDQMMKLRDRLLKYESTVDYIETDF